MRHHPDCARKDLDGVQHGRYCLSAKGRTIFESESDEGLGEMFPVDEPVGQHGPGARMSTTPLLQEMPLPPVMPADELDGLPSLLEKIDYRPDSPRFEMNYIDPDGLQINMSIEIPEDVEEYFNVQNGIDTLAVKMSDVLNDIEYAKGVYVEEMYAMKEREAEVEAEVEKDEQEYPVEMPANE